jgi:hypothetical protein
MLEIKLDGVNVFKRNNCLIIKSDTPLYILANRNGFDFKYVSEFDSHYYNEPSLQRFIVERHGIAVISTVEFFEKKYFTNISLILDVKLDNNTLLMLYKTVIETISTVSWKMNALNKDELSNKLGNYYNMVYVACRGESEKSISFDISLFYEVKELTEEALIKSFKSLENKKE